MNRQHIEIRVLRKLHCVLEHLLANRPSPLLPQIEREEEFRPLHTAIEDFLREFPPFELDPEFYFRCNSILDRPDSLFTNPYLDAFELKTLVEAELPKTPRWDSEEGKLWYGGLECATFRPDADNVRAILHEFQRRKWPRRIKNPIFDDPMKVITRQSQLGYAVDNLNKQKIILFKRDGAGGILWCLPG